MSKTLESKLACVQIVHFLSYDLKAEGNKHWNSQKQTTEKRFSLHRIQCMQSSMKKKNKSIVIFFFPKKEKRDILRKVCTLSNRKQMYTISPVGFSAPSNLAKSNVTEQ